MSEEVKEELPENGKPVATPVTSKTESGENGGQDSTHEEPISGSQGGEGAASEPSETTPHEHEKPNSNSEFQAQNNADGSLSEGKAAEHATEDNEEVGEDEGRQENEVDDQNSENEDANGDEDDNEDDEDESEGEDDEDDEADQPSKRRRLRRNQFLDVEAEVDEDEAEEEEEEGFGKDDGFIQEEPEAEGAEAAAQERIYRRVDRHDDIAEGDAEELAERYREKYGRIAASKYRQDGDVPQQLLLPSVNDPAIFGIGARLGREKEIVRALLRKSLSLQYTATPLNIFSVFQRDAFPGRIYIEAPSQAAAVHACNGVPNVYTTSRVVKVPIKEYPDMFRVHKTEDVELTPGTYVRVRRGKYTGDLAVVENLSENGLEVKLRLVPRLNYGRVVVDTAEKRKRSERPPPRLFNAQDATQSGGSLQKHGPTSYIFEGEDYDNGFLLKDFRLAYIQLDNVNPTLDEITALKGSADEGIDLQALQESLRHTQPAEFRSGESVEITQGEQTGLQGKVVSTSDDIVQVEGNDIKVSVPARHLRKHFGVGDHVRVMRGSSRDDTGLVVSRDGDFVTFLSDTKGSETTVFARDLQVASDTAQTSSVGKYNIHDLVQLNAQTVGCIVGIERDRVKVLAQDGQVATVTPQAIVMKVVNGRQIATDAQGMQIEIGDTVREISGERKQGAILHLYHQFIFLHNRELTENLGVFVTRVSQVATVATRGARAERGLDLARINPSVAAANAASQQPMGPPPPRATFNTRRMLGVKVSIGPGSGYKGLKGIVRDVNETSARVELEAKNKVVTVNVQKLLFTQNGSMVPFREFIMPARREFGSTPRVPATPSVPGAGNSGGKTPAWAASGKTPAWNGGNRTPAWNAGGAKTPAWGTGAATPAWNAGGAKTPAWNAGGRTPAWNAGGGQTPTWNAGGGRTPAWNAGGGRTPAWNAGGKTPAWSSSGAAQTPSWSSGGGSFFSAQTPGVAPTPAAYDSAPSPAPAKTPAAWGDDAPAYEPESP